MKTARMAGTASILALLVLLSGIGVASEAKAEGTSETSEFEDLTVVQEKVQNILGGGNFIGVANADRDAMIGILYGTPENPNNVYVISIFTRYLGVADVFSEKGVELAEGRPIPVKTLYAQRFDSIYEFQDSDRDGVWDSRKMAENRTDENATREPVFKKVSLNTAWSASGIHKRNNGNGSVEWQINLTAKNLPYDGPILGFPIEKQNKLEKVELSFHLYVQKRNVTRTDIPVYRVEVSKKTMKDGWNIDDVKAKENRTYSGVAVSANAKYDHYIEGWDYSKRDRNPHLLMSTEILFLNAISQKAAEWLKGQNGDKFEDGNGTATFESSIGKEKMAMRGLKQGSADPILSQNAEKPRIVRKNALGFADNWEKVGMLRWVSDVTVDGTDTQMFFQVYGGRAFAGINAKGMMFAGFGVIGGFSYPGGDKIFHDPSLSVEAFTPTSGDDSDRPIIRAIIIGMILFVGAAIFVVVIVVAVGGLMAMRRKESVGSGKGDDEDYYETYYIEKKRK